MSKVKNLPFQFKYFSLPIFCLNTSLQGYHHNVLPGQSGCFSSCRTGQKGGGNCQCSLSTCCSRSEQRSLSYRLTSRACSLVKEVTYPTDTPNNQNLNSGGCLHVCGEDRRKRNKDRGGQAVQLVSSSRCSLHLPCASHIPGSRNRHGEEGTRVWVMGRSLRNRGDEQTWEGRLSIKTEKAGQEDFKEALTNGLRSCSVSLHQTFRAWPFLKPQLVTEEAGTQGTPVT